MAGGFWRGAFEPSAFWTGEALPIVFDNPVQGSLLDFDESTALGDPAYVARPQRADIVVAGFASVGLVKGFVLPATRADVLVEGHQGALVTPASYNAIRGDVVVQGNWPGIVGKAGGLLENASDPDGDSLSFQIMSLPAHGTLQVEFNGAFLYSPVRGFSGIDGFTWRPWANGEAGNTVAVTFVVEEDRVALLGEVLVSTFTPVQAGFGLVTPAILGEVTVTGFASVGLASGFDKQPTLGAVDVDGGVPNLPPGLQALAAAVDVVGFTGIVTGGWTNRATQGTPVDVAGFPPIVSIGFNQFRAITGEIEVEGFFSATVGFVSPAQVGFVTVSGFASVYLELPLQALLGQAGPVTGFVPRLFTELILPPTTPERPADITYYNPRNHLPAGQILDRETDDVLMSYWASVDYRVLTDAEMAILCGDPLPTPVIKRSFPTGEYPLKTGTY